MDIVLGDERAYDAATWDVISGRGGRGPLTVGEMGECLRALVWGGAARPRTMLATAGVGRPDRRAWVGWLGVTDRAVDPAAQAVARELEPVLRARVEAAGRRPVVAAFAARLVERLGEPEDRLVCVAVRDGGTVLIGMGGGTTDGTALAAPGVDQAPTEPAELDLERLQQWVGALMALDADCVTPEALLGWLTARLGRHSAAVVARSGAIALYSPTPEREREEGEEGEEPGRAWLERRLTGCVPAVVLYALAETAGALAEATWTEGPTSALVLSPARRVSPHGS